jgi:three-Cys-motif partner protein
MASNTTSDFFRRERKASEIKSEVFAPYFEIWYTAVQVEQQANEVANALYLDLAAGQGHGEAGQAAIPIGLLQTIYKSRGSRLDLNKFFRTYFYDADAAYLARLKEEIEALPYHNKLGHQPLILDEEAAVEQIKETLQAGIPALAYLNPFGDSFSQEMLLQLVNQDVDLFMLFEFRELETAVKSRKVDPLVQEILGERLELIKGYYKAHRDAAKREEFAIACFEAVFCDQGYRVFLFRINLPDKKQTSHYLLFATKVDLAYLKLKEMMLRYSDYQEDGVPLFGANLQHQQMALFQEHYKYSIDGLMKDLLQKASLYNNMALQQVYEKHSVGTHYILENYKLAFERLLRQGKVRFMNPKTGQAISKPTFTSKVRFS